MNFVNIRDLSTCSAAVWAALAEAKDLVVTSNGKPVAVLSAADASTLDATLEPLRRARAQRAVVDMQHRASEAGLERWRLDEVNVEIAEARRHQVQVRQST